MSFGIISDEIDEAEDEKGSKKHTQKPSPQQSFMDVRGWRGIREGLIALPGSLYRPSALGNVRQ